VKRILTLPWGIFGSGNIGDEATLQGFAILASNYKNNFDIRVASRNPEHTRRAEPSFKYFNFQRRSFQKIWSLLISKAYWGYSNYRYTG